MTQENKTLSDQDVTKGLISQEANSTTPNVYISEI